MNYLDTPRKAASLFTLSFAGHAASILSTQAAAWAVHVELPLSFYLATLPWVWLLGMLPSLGGIGPREGGLVVALGAVGVSPELAAAVSGLTLIVRVVWSLIGGFLLATFQRAAPGR